MVEQRTPEWFAQRLGRVTGSRVKDIFDFLKNGSEGAKRKSYRQELVAERLTGQQLNPEGGYQTYDMKWGVANEAIAKQVYQVRTKNQIIEAPFVQHTPKKKDEVALMAGASPDGYVGDKGLVEIKCLRSTNHLYKAILTQEIPEEYLPQIQMQLWITDREWCDFIAYDSRLPRGLQMFVQRLFRNEEDEKILVTHVKEFLASVDKEEQEFLELGRIAAKWQGREVVTV